MEIGIAIHTSYSFACAKKKSGSFGEWLWRYPIEKDYLWDEVIRSKYSLCLNGWDAKKVSCGALEVLGRLFLRNMNLTLAILS